MHTYRQERLIQSDSRATLLHHCERIVLGCLETLLTWQERATERRALAQLDDRLLKDVGLSRADIAREVEKPFWRPSPVPPRWECLKGKGKRTGHG